jgi:hypothetical protein
MTADPTSRAHPEHILRIGLSTLNEHTTGTEPCHTVDDNLKELWFSHDGPYPTGGLTQARREAKRLCHACPIINECLTFAIQNHIPHGIWGGLVPRDRAHHNRYPATRQHLTAA